MKKITTVLAAIAFFFTTSAFALGPVSVSSNVKTIFAKEFGKAQKVKWTKASDFYFASFELDGKQVSAAYDEKGELTATSRVISLSELPLSLSMAISKKYAGYTISPTVTEVTFNGETSYSFVADNNKQWMEVSTDLYANFTVKNKLRK